MRPIHPLVVLLVTIAPAATAQSAPPTTTAAPVLTLTDSAARQGVGQVATVTGTVAQVKDHSHDGTAYLNFGGRFPAHTFSVIIPGSAVARFGDLTRFEGRRLRATGAVWLQDGKWPAMTVTDTAALAIVP